MYRMDVIVLSILDKGSGICILYRTMDWDGNEGIRSKQGLFEREHWREMKGTNWLDT